MMISSQKSYNFTNDDRETSLDIVNCEFENFFSKTACFISFKKTKVKKIFCNNSTIDFQGCDLDDLVIDDCKSLYLENSKINKITIKREKDRAFALNLLNSQINKIEFSDDVFLELFICDSKLHLTQEIKTINFFGSGRILVDFNKLKIDSNSMVSLKKIKIKSFKPFSLAKNLILYNVKNRKLDCFFPYLEELTLNQTNIKDIDKSTPQKMRIVTIFNSPIKKLRKEIFSLQTDYVFDDYKLDVKNYSLSKIDRNFIQFKKTKINFLRIENCLVNKISVDCFLELFNCPLIKDNSQIKAKQTTLKCCSCYNKVQKNKVRFLQICKKCPSFTNHKKIIKTTCSDVDTGFYGAKFYEYIKLPTKCPFVFEHVIELS